MHSEDLLGDTVFTDVDFTKADSKLENEFSTILTIGLFENKLTEKLIRQGKSEENLSDKIFYIDDTEMGRAIYVNDHLNNKVVPFYSTYNNLSSSERYDYALFGKIQNEANRSVIICGGCEGYGTKKIGQYIFANFKKMISDEEDINIKTCYAASNFISIYKIPFKSDERVTLEYHLYK